MGKRNKQKKKEVSSEERKPIIRTGNFRSKKEEIFPLPFPFENHPGHLFQQENKANVKHESTVFLRNEGPFKEAFQDSINSCYQGFACDLPSTSFTSIPNTSLITGQRKKMSNSSTSINPEDFPHEKIQQALETMHQSNYFRWDITQPFGLGTKCAKTYVTRCLLGEEGTTYKYLGLRMFSHPWSNSNQHQQNRKKKINLADALTTMKELNTTLTKRTKVHLTDLDKKRKTSPKRYIYESQKHSLQIKKKNEEDISDLFTIRGRACFDVTLINRMVDSNDLKMEPMSSKKLSSTSDNPSTTTNNDIPRTSVSWHADSCLEHYSSIAVYHTISSPSISNDIRTNSIQTKQLSKHNQNDNINVSRQWSVALRVLHNAEGPNVSSSSFSSSNVSDEIYSSSLQKNGESDVSKSKAPPPISVSLPSGSAYYLLEDFNHHHQHAVLAENTTNANITKSAQKAKLSSNPGIRYSSTHRLLRQGHNVFFILNRCQTVCSNFHKKGIKVWKTEQMLLTEIEMEWLRQFFVQGTGHKDLLWSFWKDPILKLFHYWTILEQRTKSVLDLLRFAAEEKVGKGDQSSNNNTIKPSPSRKDRKLKEKRKKAITSLQHILERSGSLEDKTSIQHSDRRSFYMIYQPLSGCIRDRAEKRNHWASRENDPVFYSMDKDCRPIPFPVIYACNHENLSKNKNDHLGHSPMGGTPEELLVVANALECWGKSFDSRDSKWMPKIFSDYSDQSQNRNAIKQSASSEKDEHRKDLEWDGWNSSKRFGLEMQDPFAGLLLDGKKTIETRAYDLPVSLIGKKVEVLESKSGKDGVSGLQDIIFDESVNNRDSKPSIQECISRVGWCKFEKVIKYNHQDHFEADESLHFVRKESGYGWKNGMTKVIYGWVVGEYFKYDKSFKLECDRPNLSSLTRRMRSLFELKFSNVSKVAKIPAHGVKKRKKSNKKTQYMGGKLKKKRRF